MFFRNEFLRGRDSNPSPPPTNRRRSATLGSAAGGRGGREGAGLDGRSLNGRIPPSPPPSNVANHGVRGSTRQIEGGTKNDEKVHAAGRRSHDGRPRGHRLQEEGTTPAADAPQGAPGQPGMPGAPHGEAGAPPVEKKVVVPSAVKAGWKAAKIEVEFKEKKSKKAFTVPLNSEFKVPDTDLTLRIGNFLPHFTMAADQITSGSNNLENPAVQARGVPGREGDLPRLAVLEVSGGPPVHARQVRGGAPRRGEEVTRVPPGGAGGTAFRAAPYFFAFRSTSAICAWMSPLEASRSG